MYRIPSGRDTIEVLVENHLSHGKILARHVHSRLDGQTVYAAIENQEGQVEGWVLPFTGAAGGQVCVSGPFQECELPYSFLCPAEILDLLSPTSDPNSLEWRRRCRLP